METQYRALLGYGMLFYSEQEVEKFIWDFCDNEHIKESIRESWRFGADIQDAVSGAWFEVTSLGPRRGFFLGKRITHENGYFEEGLSFVKSMWNATFTKIQGEVISEIEVI